MYLILHFKRSTTGGEEGRGSTGGDYVKKYFGCDVLMESNNIGDAHQSQKETMWKMELILYEVISKRAWADLLMQTYKVALGWRVDVAGLKIFWWGGKGVWWGGKLIWWCGEVIWWLLLL